jgi:hypothetical protein
MAVAIGGRQGTPRISQNARYAEVFHQGLCFIQQASAKERHHGRVRPRDPARLEYAEPPVEVAHLSGYPHRFGGAPGVEGQFGTDAPKLGPDPTGPGRTR